ncbi:hypothetical protein EOZ92_25260 [Salmonella enterica]|nr:hypothetical protein [Salmonella enterica]EAM5856841.1 hypothetical protein [Salmonella enterica]EAS3180292.1 hypothetical protein [Salmonella enterica]
MSVQRVLIYVRVLWAVCLKHSVDGRQEKAPEDLFTNQPRLFFMLQHIKIASYRPKGQGETRP